MQSPERSLNCLHSTTACTARWSFCDSSYAIMVSKSPSEPSGNQELRARRAAPGLHGTHPPSHSACGCQPSSRFSAAGLFYPVRFDWPLCFAPTLLISLACTCISRKAALLHARMHAPPTHCSSCARMLRLLSFARTTVGSYSLGKPRELRRSAFQMRFARIIWYQTIYRYSIQHRSASGKAGKKVKKLNKTQTKTHVLALGNKTYVSKRVGS